VLLVFVIFARFCCVVLEQNNDIGDLRPL